MRMFDGNNLCSHRLVDWQSLMETVLGVKQALPLQSVCNLWNTVTDVFRTLEEAASSRAGNHPLLIHDSASASPEATNKKIMVTSY